MADLVWVQWYATVLRKDSFAAAVAEVAPLALRYGATQYEVHVSNDDRYKITQMTWVPSQDGLVPLLGRAGDDRVPRAQRRASTRSRSATPGPTRSPPGRSGPRSSDRAEPPPSPALPGRRDPPA